MKRFLVITLVLVLALGLVLTGCGGKKAEEPKKEEGFKVLTGDALVEAAKKEGEIVSYGMPDSWANLGEIWANVTAKYGLKHTDTDMSSAEELAKFQAEKDKPVADVGDVGITFGPKGKEMGVLAPHKNPWWNEIPDWAKDPEGYWTAQYQGTIAFIVNAKKVPSVPKSFADLLKPEFKGMVSIDDPTRSAQAKAGVLAAAFANGGDETNIQPGIDFWAKLVKQGNFRPLESNVSNIQKGEVVIGIIWDFNALGYKKQLNMPELEVVIPSDGSVTLPYVAVINKYAPHPYAARLLNDYLFSDEGQIAYAKGFARPIRKVTLPPEVAAAFPPESAYAAARPVKDLKAYEKAANETIPQLWESQVLAGK